MNEHEQICSLLPVSAGGELSQAEQQLLDQHLAECPACRQELEQLRLLLKEVHAIPELEPPAWLASRIMAQVRDESPERRSWLASLLQPLQVRLPLEALALVVICITAWYVMQEVERSKFRPESQAPAPSAAVPPSTPQNQQKSVASDAPALKPSTPAVIPAPAIIPPQQADHQRSPQAPVATMSAPPQKPERGSSLEQSRERLESRPSQAAGTREQAAEAPAPVAERKSAAKRKAESGDTRLEAAPPSRLQLRLVVEDREATADRLRTIAQRLGGSLVVSRTGSATLRLQSSRLPALQEQLATLGRIADRQLELHEPAEWVIVQISW